MTRQTELQSYDQVEYDDPDKRQVDALQSFTEDVDHDLSVPRYLDLLPEGAQTGQTADATGVQYEGDSRILVPQALEDTDQGVYIEASLNSSAGDEEVTVELYDDDDSSVADSFTVTGGSPRARSGDVSSNLSRGNEAHVRFNVTSASGTTDATFDAVAARLVVE